MRDRRLLPLLLLACIIVSTPLQSFGATNWEQIGPAGGDQFEVKISPADPNLLFALAWFGFHRSTDGGATWKPVHTVDLATGGCFSMVFNPTNPSHLFVASSTVGVWESNDAGETWEASSNGLPQIAGTEKYYYPVVSLAATANGTLYAGMSESDVAGAPPAFIYRSEDGGANWSPSQEGVQMPQAAGSQKTTALLSTDRSGRLWAMVYGAGLHTFENTSWVQRNGNLPASALSCTFLEHDPQDADHLLLATERSWIFETKDGGSSWTPLNLPTPLQEMQALPLTYSIRIDPNNSHVIYVDTKDFGRANELPIFQAKSDQVEGFGGFMTVDGGGSWIERAGGNLRLTVDPRETIEDTIYPYGTIKRSKTWYKARGGYESLQKSTDGCVTFSTITNGLTNNTINKVWVHPAPEGSPLLFAGVESGLFLKKGSQQDWDFQFTVANQAYTWSFAAAYSNPGSVLYSIGNPAWSFPNDRGIYRADLSTMGPTGPLPTQILSNVGVWNVITVPSRPQTIYAACQEEGIKVSHDNGLTWTDFNQGLDLPKSVTDIELDADGNPIYAAVRESNGNLSADPPQPWWTSPEEQGGVYAFNSQTGSWSRLPGISAAVVDLELHPTTTAVLYAGTSRGLYKTVDGGNSWVAILPDLVISDVLIDHQKPDYIFAATAHGVLRSTDAGKTWHEFSDGLTLKNVFSLALDSSTGVLYAGTGGNSVFQWIPEDDPQASLAVSPEVTTFGVTPIGSSLESVITISNEGEGDLIITGILSSDPAFGACEISLPLTIPPRTQSNIKLRFTPLQAGIIEGALAIHSNDPTRPLVDYRVSGTGREVVSPVPGIYVNGKDGVTNLPFGNLVNIAITLSAGDYLRASAEWWVTAVSGSSTFWFVPGRGWLASQTPIPARIGPLGDIPSPLTILSSRLPRGEYVLKFVIDNFMNNSLDEVWTGTATVKVQ